MFEYLTANWMDLLGTTLGLLYLYLEMKENAWMWVVGSVMPVIYIFVLYKAGLYADCGMEVYYFLAGLYGLAVWLSGNRKEEKRLRISHAPRSTKSMCWITMTILWMALGTMLDRFTDSTVPYIDGFTTAASIVGLWMLSRKYIEQWWVWLVVDAVSTALYVYKGIYGRATLYLIYTAIATYGYFVWKARMARQTKG